MGLFDKARDFARGNPDKVEAALDKAGDAFDQRTGGKHAARTDSVQQKAGEFLTGRTADAPDVAAQSIVVQREVGTDTRDFRTALKYAMRQDPDVIMIGEMRDKETVEAALSAAQTGHLVKIEIEVDSLEQLQEVLDTGLADVVLIDNFDIAAMKKAVATVNGRLVIEASGGITLDSIAGIAATGVDYASSGAFTLSAPALDVGLDIEM